VCSRDRLHMVVPMATKTANDPQCLLYPSKERWWAVVIAKSLISTVNLVHNKHDLDVKNNSCGKNESCGYRYSSNNDCSDLRHKIIIFCFLQINNCQTCFSNVFLFDALTITVPHTANVMARGRVRAALQLIVI